jgi:hypothetical protein
MTTTSDIELAIDDDSRDERPQPTYTWSQAQQGGLTTHKIFMLINQIWIMVVDYHLRVGTPRHQWEPTDAACHLLCAHYEQEVAERLEPVCGDDLDPAIQDIEDIGTEIETLFRELTDRDPRLTSSETGSVYTESGAVTQVERSQAKINSDIRRGRSHHKRVPAWVRVLGKIMPYGEGLGLVVLLTFWLNVEWTRPLVDPLTWTLALVVVLATLLFIPRVVERAAEGWNKRREAIAENQAEAKQAAIRRLFSNGVIALVVSLAIVTGLIERALAVIDSTIPQSMLVLIMALCIIAGLAMPAVSFIAIAWDGSSCSRENDDLIDQLDAGRAEDQDLRSKARSLADTCHQEETHINTELAPAILRTAFDIANEAWRAYVWLRVQIGGLPTAPPRRPEQDLTSDQPANIETGIPGAEPIRLEPLVSRGLRMKELRRHRSEMMSKLAEMPAHPWAGN